MESVREARILSDRPKICPSKLL